MSVSLDPQRVIRLLRELAALTSDANGAQRVAFTPTWKSARAWLRKQAEDIGLKVSVDPGGNMWCVREGRSKRKLVLGGHIDSVPNGGWLDGALNIVAALEIMRVLASMDDLPFTVCVVCWCDEEGARFGKSLFGSSAASGTIDLNVIRGLKDSAGVQLVDVLAEHGLNIDTLTDCGSWLDDVAAYLELHIEQGPVLEALGLSLAAVLGTFGINRNTIRFVGQAAHSGSTPMHLRRDALAAASKLALEIREIAKRHGGVCTSGNFACAPGIPTSVVGQCDMQLDQRHLEAGPLQLMLEEAKAAAARFAAEEGCTVEWFPLMVMPPVPFDPQLIALTEAAIVETCGTSHRMPSGPLHDAAEIARRGIPTVMMFVQSLLGISHNKIENTRDADIVHSVAAFYSLALKTLDWMKGLPA